MKKTSTSAQTMLRAAYLMMLCLFILGTSVSAQDSASRTTDNDPYAEFAKTNPNSPLVKLYLANPDVPEIVRAYKNAALVSNPSAFPDFSKEDVAKRKAELDAFNTSADDIYRSIEKGMSYDIAKYRMELKKAGEQNHNQK